MFEALKIQAEEFFKVNSNVIEHHKTLQRDKDIRKFYTLLIAKHIDSPNNLLDQIIQLQKHDTIKWGFLLQSIWGISLMFQQPQEGTDNIDPQLLKIATFITKVNARNIIDRNTLFMQLPDYIITAAKLIQAQSLKKKSIRAYTKINYEQNKFNLLRQNNEGYTKISLLLLTLKHQTQYSTIWEKVVSIIGYFDLDPDRVLDLIIEAYTQNTNSPVYLQFIKKFNRQSISPLLGLKLRKGTPATLSQQLRYVCPVEDFIRIDFIKLWKMDGFIPNPKLISITAKLIKNNIINLQDIVPYLGPTQQAITKIQLKRIQEGKQKIYKSFVMAMQEPDPKEKERIFQQEQFVFMGQLIYSNKLALLSQLVRQNDWGNFSTYWKMFHKKIDLLVYQSLLKNLINLLQWMIDPVQSKTSMARYFRQEKQTCETFQIQNNVETLQKNQLFQINAQFFAQINDIFAIIGPYLGFNTKVFIKFCRLFYKLMAQPEAFELQPDKVPKEQIMKIIKLYLIPGVSYQSNNPTLGLQLYKLLEIFDYKFRYNCYLHFYKEGMSSTPYLCKIFEKIKNKQNIIVNNLSKDNKKIFHKKMAKITHNQALQVFFWIVRRLMKEDYDAVVPQIVAVLNNCTPLTLQMVIFVFIYSLAQTQSPSVNCKTGQSQAWYKNIVTFISLFYRKYLQTDIQPVFDYIVMKLGQSIKDLEDNQEMPGTLLKLLQAVLNKMYGSLMMEEISKSKYEILAAGPRLQFQALYLSSEARAAKKSKVILQNFFWNKSKNYSQGKCLALFLLILIIQKRSQFIKDTFHTNLKLIGDIYDDFTNLFIHLIKFLNYQATDYIHYSKLVPNNVLDMLCNQVKLPIQAAFQIYRPAVKQIATMNEEQWETCVQSVNKIMKVYLSRDDIFLEGRFQTEKLRSHLNIYKQKFQYIDMPFFTNFWLLTLDAIYFPTKIYQEKIQELNKKRISEFNSNKKNDKNDREQQKTKILLEKLTTEQQHQKDKAAKTFTSASLNRFKVSCLKASHLDSLEKSQANNTLDNFAQIFVQVCLLPRMTLQGSHALYCAKFNLQLIKVNKLSISRSMKLLKQIVQLVMSYLPYATQKQCQNCLSIFLGEILTVFSNWSNEAKLKQDFKQFLGIEDSQLKTMNYAKTKDFILKLFQRVGKMIKSIKDEPYSIKNCLYFLSKVEVFPGYKQQADQLQEHLKQLIKLHPTVDMETILTRQISTINAKKFALAQKVQQKLKNPNEVPKEQTNKGKSPLETNKQPINKGKSPQNTNKQSNKQSVNKGKSPYQANRQAPKGVSPRYMKQEKHDRTDTNDRQRNDNRNDNRNDKNDKNDKNDNSRNDSRTESRNDNNNRIDRNERYEKSDKYDKYGDRYDKNNRKQDRQRVSHRSRSRDKKKR